MLLGMVQCKESRRETRLSTKMCSVGVVIIIVLIQSGYTISTKPHNGTAQILWNLSQPAIQSRQRPSQFQLHPELFSHYTESISPQLNFQTQYGQKYPNGHKFPVRPKPIPALPPGYQQHPQSFTAVLQSLAQNDDLRCVPRLLCELTSGPKKAQESPAIFGLDLSSIIGFLGTVAGMQSSPLFEFGKAILLGYSSKGKPDTCSYAYSQCPKDSDKLVEYLNNHNGGLFRLFNGIPSNRYNPQPDHLNTQILDPKFLVENRIQTKPLEFLEFIRFPDTVADQDYNNEVAPQIVFPEQANFKYPLQQVKEYTDKRAKAIIFPVERPYSLKSIIAFPDRANSAFKLYLEELYGYKN